MVSDHFLQAAAGSTCSGPLPITASPATVGSSGSILNASAKGGAWRTKPAETAVSRSLPAWPLRDGAFSGTPGGSALAAYPREVARCEQGVLYECGLAQVGFGATCSPPFLHLSVSSLVNLVRATAAHAAGKGEAGDPGLPLPVVAMGSIPHIYRREGLSPGDPNQSCPVPRNHAACFPTSIPVRTEFLQGQ